MAKVRWNAQLLDLAKLNTSIAAHMMVIYELYQEILHYLIQDYL